MASSEVIWVTCGACGEGQTAHWIPSACFRCRTVKGPMALVWLETHLDAGALRSDFRVELLGDWPERAARRVRAQLLTAHGGEVVQR